MQFISAVLPQAIITILVVYCLKDISFINAPFRIPELIAVCDCSVIAMVEREYAAEYLCPNGHLYGVITSDVKLTYMLIEAA